MAAPINNIHVAGISSPAFSSFFANYAENLSVIDSGASSHICYSKRLFHNMQPILNTSVVLPTLTSVQVNFIGEVFISRGLITLGCSLCA